MFSNNRDAYRQAFFTVWQKYQKQLPLEPVERELAQIMIEHPEYHYLLEKPDSFQQQEFSLEENPFFHMSLHLAIRDQLRLRKPVGVDSVYHALLQRGFSSHQAEHQMMACLAESMWEAQQKGEIPKEESYLIKLQKIL